MATIVERRRGLPKDPQQDLLKDASADLPEDKPRWRQRAEVDLHRARRYRRKALRAEAALREAEAEAFRLELGGERETSSMLYQATTPIYEAQTREHEPALARSTV